MATTYKKRLEDLKAEITTAVENLPDHVCQPGRARILAALKVRDTGPQAKAVRRTFQFTCEGHGINVADPENMSCPDMPLDNDTGLNKNWNDWTVADVRSFLGAAFTDNGQSPWDDEKASTVVNVKEIKEPKAKTKAPTVTKKQYDDYRAFVERTVLNYRSGTMQQKKKFLSDLGYEEYIIPPKTITVTVSGGLDITSNIDYALGQLVNENQYTLSIEQDGDSFSVMPA